MLPASIPRLLREQDGVIGRAQARRRGLSPRMIDGLIGRGEWRIVQPAVYRSSVVPASPTNVIRAAALSLRPDGVVSGHAAAFWWGLTEEPPHTITVVVPRGRRPSRRHRVAIVRSEVPAEDVVLHRDLRVLSLALSCIRGAVELDRQSTGRGAQMLDRALQRRVRPEAVLDALERNCGAAGNRAARKLLAATADGAASAAERLCARLMRQAGISGWRANHPVLLEGRWRRIDLAFVAERVAIEVDGWAFHHTPDRFVEDRRRQNSLVSAGWLVLRFTWADLTERPDYVVRVVLDALAGRRRSIMAV